MRLTCLRVWSTQQSAAACTTRAERVVVSRLPLAAMRSQYGQIRQRRSRSDTSTVHGRPDNGSGIGGFYDILGPNSRNRRECELRQAARSERELSRRARSAASAAIGRSRAPGAICTPGPSTRASIRKSGSARSPELAALRVMRRALQRSMQWTRSSSRICARSPSRSRRPSNRLDIPVRARLTPGPPTEDTHAKVVAVLLATVASARACTDR